MRREHGAVAKGGGGETEDLFLYLPLDGDFIDRTDGSDISVCFDVNVNGVTTMVSWCDDPVDSSRKCLQHTNGATYKSFMPLRKLINGVRTYYIPANTPKLPPSNHYALLGKTLEFWWHPLKSSGSRYILENVDSLISTSTSGLYGYDLYRNGTYLYFYAKGRSGNADNFRRYVWGSFTNGRWYRMTVAFRDNGDSTYNSIYKLYDSDGTCLLDSGTLGMPAAPHGTSNSLCTAGRGLLFFHSSYSYCGVGVNNYDYLKEIKIYNCLL